MDHGLVAVIEIMHHDDPYHYHQNYKHIHVIDLAGVTMTDFSKLKKILPPIFKQTGDQYPNSLYKLFITNAPSLFTVSITSYLYA